MQLKENFLLLLVELWGVRFRSSYCQAGTLLTIISLQLPFHFLISSTSNMFRYAHLYLLRRCDFANNFILLKWLFVFVSITSSYRADLSSKVVSRQQDTPSPSFYPSGFGPFCAFTVHGNWFG